jgi:hypothetical protein
MRVFCLKARSTRWYEQFLGLVSLLASFINTTELGNDMMGA